MLEEDLQLGDTGDSVKVLQEKLKILGFYNAVVNGSFGLTTEVGVKAFQKEYGLEETGIVDKEMWEKLFLYTEISTDSLRQNPILSLGDSGVDVRNLQTKLKVLLYYTGPISSTFDTETQSAVKRLQYNNNITTTGVVNNQTWELIDFLYGSLNACVTGNTSNNGSTYTVVRGDRIFMGNNE